MTAWLGLMLLPLVGLGVVGTGLPAFLMLLLAASLGAFVAMFSGDGRLLTALPTRLIGLLESDLMQALPLFVLMGTLINRLPLAEILFRAFRRMCGQNAAAPQLAALGLGTLLAPMNGSVGASVSVMVRSIRPILAAESVPQEERIALLSAASTLGVVIPPSLVLIFMGDAMMAAHTIASNVAKRSDQIINTQDIFRSALVPAAATLLLWIAIVIWRNRTDPNTIAAAAPSLSKGESLVAGLSTAFIIMLLAGVATGLFYAVEAAAMGCVMLFIAAAVGGYLRSGVLRLILMEAIAISGALFALLIAATTFTLILKVLGTDALLSAAMAALPGGEKAAVLAGLALIMISALVLDAFEIIFVVIPVLMPGILVRAPDAAWVAALTILALQTSFLIPPVGYAIMMTRSAEPEALSARMLTRAVAPFVAAPLLVIALTIVFPAMTHVFDPPKKQAAQPILSEKEISQRFNLPLPDASPLSLPGIKID